MNNKLHKIAELAIFASLGCVLDIIGTFICISWGNGFAITLSLVTIALTSYRWGILDGILTGALTGLLDLLFCSFLGGMIDPLQGIIEYPIALLIFGLCGITRKNILEEKKIIPSIVLPLLILCIIKTAIHSVCGVIYWKWEFLPALGFNALFIALSLIIDSILIYIAVKRINKLLIN